MTYKEFTDHVARKIPAYLPEEYNLSCQMVDKLQGQSYYGLYVRHTSGHCGVSVDLTEFYKKFLHGEPERNCLRAIADKITSALGSMPDLTFVDQFYDYEEVRERLILQLVPMDGNEYLLSDVPYKHIEDMAIVYRIFVSDNGEGMSSVLVRNSLFIMWGITSEQLHKDALVSAPRLMPAMFTDMAGVMVHLFGEIDPRDNNIPRNVMYVLTSEKAINGAACLFYPGMMQLIADSLGGGDYYILPSSIHELIVVPATTDISPEDLTVMVREVNDTQVAPEDRLSYTVFHYNAKDRAFESVENYKLRKMGGTGLCS